MSTNDDYIAIDIALSFESPAAMQAFIDRLTGNDDDIILAAESGMNKALGVDSYMDGVQVHPPTKEAMQEVLDDHLAAKARKRDAALIRLGYDAKIRELELQRDRELAEYR